MIHEFVVTAMVSRPSQSRALKSSGSKEKDVEFYYGICLERKMGKKAVVAERDTHAGRKCEEKKQRGLKEVDAILPDVEWDGRAGDGERPNQEDAVCNADFAQKFIHEDRLRRLLGQQLFY
jgi:hypothetical protein